MSKSKVIARSLDADIKAYKGKCGKNAGKLGRVGRAIIVAVGAAGFLTAAVLAPNVLQLLDDRRTRQKEWHMKNVLGDLVYRGLLKRVKDGDTIGYELTRKGQDVADAYELGTLTIDKPRRWDGKWRIVAFDIKEFKKSAREELRSLLVALGFEKLQRSIWIHPYPCADVISLVKRKYDLGKDVLYMEVDVLENDHWLRDAFFLR